MPVWAVWIVGGLLSAAGQFVLRAMFATGVTLLTTKFLLPPARQLLQSYATALPDTAFQLFGYMGIDRGLTMILSAYVVATASRLALAKKGD